MKKSLVVLLCAAIGTPAVAEAQLAFEVEPIVGVYSPRGSYVHSATYFYVGTPDSPRDNGGTAYGANARLWLTRSFGVQLQEITSSATHPPALTPGGATVTTSTRVRAVTAEALFRPALPTRAQLWLSAGGGRIRHSGSAYAPYGSPSNRTIALGAGASIPLWHGLSATAGVDDLIYDWKITDPIGTYQTGSQSDIVGRIGLSLTVR